MRHCRLVSEDSAMQRVLLIDDDKAVGEATKIMLEAEGFDVVVADDGHAGLRAMEAGRFDLAIVDLFMPGMDGLETASRLRRLNPNLPIIAMSGFMFRGECPPMPHFSSMAQEAGADATLYKPFRPHELLQAIRVVTIASQDRQTA
jgi:CheY-like chemotaxis protein